MAWLGLGLPRWLPRMADKLVQEVGRRPQFLVTEISLNPRICKAEAVVSCALAWKSYIDISAVFYWIRKPVLVSVVWGTHKGVKSKSQGLLGTVLEAGTYMPPKHLEWHVTQSEYSLNWSSHLAAHTLTEGQGALEGYPGKKTPTWYVWNLVTWARNGSLSLFHK